MVTFGSDPSLAATYNAKHDTKYAVLDESYYEFPERTATVEAGKSVSEPLTIHFKNLDQLDIDATQLLPVTIVSAGGGLSTLSGSQTVYYLVRRSSAITTAAVLTDNWIDVPAFDKAGTADQCDFHNKKYLTKYYHFQSTIPKACYDFRSIFLYNTVRTPLGTILDINRTLTFCTKQRIPINPDLNRNC